MKITWFGHSCFRIETGGSNILIDPFLTGNATFEDADIPLHKVAKGGTHVAWSPPFHYLQHVYLPTLRRMGVEAQVELVRWGFYPQGGGEMRATIKGSSGQLRGLDLTERGALRRLWGFSAAANLPAHVARRQRRRAEEVLGERGLAVELEIVDAPSPGPGTCLFLLAECENAVAGFTAYGRQGKPAEKVAEEACRELLQWYDSGAALDRHLPDQLVLPMALAANPSDPTTCEETEHLRTNRWVVGRVVALEPYLHQ